MEVKDFVAQAIIEIIEGVKLAQEFAQKNNAIVNSGKEITDGTNPKVNHGDPLSQNIDFELLITTSDNIKTSTGLQVFFPTIIGAGGSSHHDAGDVTANHIKFTVPVVFPKQKPLE